MSGWQIVDHHDRAYKSWGGAVQAFLSDPSLTFFEETLYMHGSELEPATEEVRRRAEKEADDARV